MAEYIEQIIQYTDNELSDVERIKFEKDLGLNLQLKEEFILFKRINFYMKTRIQLESAKEEAGLNKIGSYTQNIVNEYYNNLESNESKTKEISGFINSIFIQNEMESKLIREIEIIKNEALEKNIDQITQKWVKDWMIKKNKLNNKTEEIRNFVKEGMIQAGETVVPSQSKTVSPPKNFFKIIFKKKEFYFAAAIIFMFLLIGIIYNFYHPSYTNDELFAMNYQPAKSLIYQDRGEILQSTDIYQVADELYNQGNYIAASEKYDSLFLKNNMLGKACFFAGICKIEKGEFNNAIVRFQYTIDKFPEFQIVATWYLGLSYVKLGNKSMAIELLKKFNDEAYKGIYKEKALMLIEQLRK